MKKYIWYFIIPIMVYFLWPKSNYKVIDFYRTNDGTKRFLIENTYSGTIKNIPYDDSINIGEIIDINKFDRFLYSFISLIAVFGFRFIVFDNNYDEYPC